MAGFPPETLEVLRALAADPTPERFDALRQDYLDHWLAPARAFVTGVGPRLAGLSSGLVADPRVHGSILHPRQDVRFADRPPYRDHVGLIFWEGDRATATSVLFLRLHADHLTLGVGARRLDRDQLAAYRRAVVNEPGVELADVAAVLDHDGWDLRGSTLRTGPRDLATDDPGRARLLRHTALWASADMPHPSVLATGRLPAWCARRWQKLMPLHRWLVAHVPPRVSDRAG